MSQTAFRDNNRKFPGNEDGILLWGGGHQLAFVGERKMLASGKRNSRKLQNCSTTLLRTPRGSRLPSFNDIVALAASAPSLIFRSPGGRGYLFECK